MDSEPLNGKILIVDDEAPIRKFLSINLAAHGYTVLEADRGKKALEITALNTPDMIILDLVLPDMDGTDLIKKLRKQTKIPILVLSGRADEEIKVKALDCGANDYVTKPFGVAELMARLRNLARTYKMESCQTDGEVFEQGKLKIDYASRTIRLNGKSVRLTRREYDLLRLLIRNAGKVLTHAFLLRELFGSTEADHVKQLRVHIVNLRKKLGDDPDNPSFIASEYNLGYRFLIS
jgi:two-component system KDP operon response regulator KdpE